MDSRWLVAPLGVGLVGLMMVGKYDAVVGVLRYLLLGFLAFAVAALLAHPDWSRLAISSLIPRLSLRGDVIGGGLALLGTALTSYVYVWETIERESKNRSIPVSGAAGWPGRGSVPSSVRCLLR